jgi:DHA1 family tetracycline resistance protein-like MFS transporter
MNNKPLIPIFLIVFIDLLGFGVIIPLLPNYAASFGASDTLIGILLASYSAAQFIGAPVLGRLSDRFGRKPLLLISQAGTFAGFILLAAAHTLPLLFVSRLLDGFTGGNLSIAQAAIADVTTEQDRAKAYGLIGAAFGLGFILGPALGGLLSRWGYAAPALAAALISAVTITMTVIYFPETRRANAGPTARREFSVSALQQALANTRLLRLLGLGLIYSFAFAIFQTTFPLFAKAQFGFSAEQTGYTLAYSGVLIVIAQLGVLPRLVKWLGERRMLIVGVAGLGAGLLMVGLINTWPPLLIALIFASLGGAVVSPALQSLYTQSVSADERGGVLGLAASADSLARIAAPIWGGWVLGQLGAHAPALSAAAILLVALLYALALFWSALNLARPQGAGGLKNEAEA